MLVLCVLCAAPAFGYRHEYRVTLNGARKSGAEVCFYRAKSAIDAFSLFFSYDRAICLPADKILDFPPGMFHVIARHQDGYVSAHRDYSVYSGPPAPEAGYESFEVPLEEGAWVDVSGLLPRVKQNERLGVWIAPTPQQNGTFFPLMDGETSIMVPARRPFLPILLSNEIPVAVGEPMVLAARERASAPPFARLSGRTDVAVWLKLDSTSETATIVGMAPPQIAISTAEETVEPVFPLFAGTVDNNTVMLFKDVPVGPAKLTIRGKTWVNAEVDVSLGPLAVNNVRDPIVLIPGASVDVSWNIDLSSYDLDDCGKDKVVRQVTATLASCPELGVSAACSPVATESTDLSSDGKLSFEGVMPGRYSVALQHPSAKTATIPIDLAVGQEVAVRAPLQTFRFFGTVTLNGEPVRATLRFDGGESQSDMSGRYTAALPSDPLTNLIQVLLCNEDRVTTYVPEASISENSSYDIELRQRRLIVQVVATGGRPVADAAVRFAPIRAMGLDSNHEVYYSSADQLTAANGRVTFEDVPEDRPFVACAEHREYTQTCTSVVSESEIHSGELTITLRDAMLRGRVEGHEGIGILASVDRLGRITQQATIRADGRFTLESVGMSEEYLVYASSRRPLAVLPIPQVRKGEVVVSLPAVTGRSFTVNVTGMKAESGFLGVWIGDRYIPLDILVFHHDYRRVDVLIRRDRPVTLVDLAQTAPITIAYVPDAQMGGEFVDPFTLPQYISVPRHAVTGESVTFADE